MARRARRRTRKLPESPVTLSIESLSHDGRGIARLEGKTLFVENALVGETVSARYLHSKSQYDELVAEEILENPSEDRVEPPCAHAALCGGCSLQHMDPDAQIRHKEQVMLDQLRHFGQLQPEEVVPPLIAERLGYRTKARLGVRYVVKRDEVLMGFREKHSNFLTAMGDCPILVHMMAPSLADLKQVIRGLSIFDRIPQVELACGDERAAVIVRHMEPLSEADQAALVAWGEKHSVAVFLQPKGPATVHCVYTPWEDSELSFSLDDGTNLVFRPTDFTQVNLPLNRQMVARAIEWLAPTPQDRVLDLFCGLGNFTLALSRHCQEVLGIEGSEDMVVRGELNARRNGIENARFAAANLHDEELLNAEDGEDWANNVDCLLLDPPRSGAEVICQRIERIAPKRIVYVSCNPATLARDAGLLVEAGYRLKKAGVMDMFPHTTHVESMALFERN